MAAKLRNATGLYGTQRRDLQNRRLQVRFLSHLPHFSLISWGLERLNLSPLTAVVTAVCAFSRRQPKTQIC